MKAENTTKIQFDSLSINEAYAAFFPENPPARFVVEVSALPKDAQVEIDAIAAL